MRGLHDVRMLITLTFRRVSNGTHRKPRHHARGFFVFASLLITTMNYPFPPSTDSTPFTLRGQTCPNNACEQYGEEGRGNIIIHSRKHQRFQCNRCKRSWVAHKNTLRYRLRTEIAAVQRATEWLAYGLSIRRTAHRLNVSPSTVLRWKKKFLISNHIPH